MAAQKTPIVCAFVSISLD